MSEWTANRQRKASPRQVPLLYALSAHSSSSTTVQKGQYQGFRMLASQLFNAAYCSCAAEGEREASAARSFWMSAA
eukprot:5430226-Pleurochrysis_carterae.AAC.1